MRTPYLKVTRIKFLFASPHTLSMVVFASWKHANSLVLGHHSELITNSIKGPTSPSPRCPPKTLNRIMSSKQGEWRGGRRWGVSNLNWGGDKRGGVSTATESSCLSHMARVPIETSEQRLEAQPLVHVLEANGSSMSGAQQNRAMTADSLPLNRTAALGLHDQEMDTALFGVLYSFLSAQLL